MSRLIVAFTLIVMMFAPLTISADNLLNEPEGIVYDSVYNRYLVSCWRNGAVIAIDSNGVQSYFRTGLGNCASIIISGDTVFVALNNESVVGLDLHTGATLMYRTFAGAGGCHDIAVDTSGYLYASDWGGHRIYRVDLSDNTYTVFVALSDGIYDPLGLEYDAFNNRLIVTPMEADIPIRAVSLPDGTVTDIIDPGIDGMDCINRDHLGNYYITSITGSGINAIYRFDSMFARPAELIQGGFNGIVDVCYNRKENILAATEYFAHTVHYLPMSGKLTFDNQVLSDATYGDNDGVPEGGETVEFIFDLYNSGVETVSGLNVSLIIDDPSLNIISGSADLGDVPVQSTVSNSAMPFVVEIPSDYISRCCKFYIEARWHSRFGLEVDTLIARVNVGKCSIMLVDDDFGDDLESYYTDCLDHLAVPYDYHENSPAPTFSEMNNYDIIIWFTGDLMSQPLDAGEVDSLAAFLDNGGKLFLTGQHIAGQLDFSWPDFLHDYLKSEFVSTSLIPLLTGLPGGQVFDSTDKIAIVGNGGAYNQTAPAHLNALSGAVGELIYSTQTTLGSVSYDGPYQLVFFAFGFEAIVNGDSRYTERIEIMTEILDFFGYQLPVAPMSLAVAPGDPTHLIEHNPEFSWKQGDPEYLQTEYQVQVGSDNDWSVAEMWDSGPVTGSDTSAIYAGTELTDGNSYAFRVQTYNGTVWSSWYYGSMRMNSVPAGPTDLAPDGLEEIESTSPELSHGTAIDAEGDGLTYAYEIYDDELLTSLIGESSGNPQGAGDTTFWTVPWILPDGEDYFWRVRAEDGYEAGEWSQTASFYIIAGYVCGDANGDGMVNVGDAVFIINYVFKGGAAPERLEAADANADGECNVADAVYLINHIFKGGNPPLCP